ncbi:porin [Inquilinus sp.]|jgi:hypothetical protein|uniref:porin n=1 Tax=Inquilinus sp. TaxID=1932117 RepID=UPI003783A448
MKKILLGGTALAVAAMASVPASAALEVKISGFVAFQAALVLDTTGTDGDRDRDYDFGSGARLQFDIKNVTDSGLEYGARIRMNNVNRRQGVTVDRTYVYVKGGFGTIVLGDAPGTGADFGYVFAHDSVVSGMGFAGGYGDNIDGRYDYGGGDFFSLDPTYHSGLGNDTKIKYASPTFGGFSFGIDFTPVVGGSSHSGPGGTNDLTNDGNTLFENVVTGAANYTGDFDGLSLIVSGTATYGNGVGTHGGGLGTGHFDLETYTLGAQVGSGGITGSVNWVNTSKGFGGGATDKAFNTVVGSLAYQWNQFAFGLGYAYTWAEKNNDLAGSIAGSGFDLKDNHIVSGTVAYNIAPGLNTWAEVTWERQNFRKDTVGGVTVDQKNSEDNTILMTGLQVSF